MCGVRAHFAAPCAIPATVVAKEVAREYVCFPASFVCASTVERVVAQLQRDGTTRDFRFCEGAVSSRMTG